MKEHKIELFIRKYLTKRGWDIKNSSKKQGEHGVDILASHPSWMKILLIEVKGGSGKHKHQEIHNAFYNLLGQCLARMDKAGNDPNKARIYGFGIPQTWVGVFKKKIKKMKHGWALLKLRGFIVKENGQVIEKPYSFFLK